MRVFWIVIGVLGIAAVVLAFRPHAAGSDGDRDRAAPAGSAAVAMTQAASADKPAGPSTPRPPTTPPNQKSASTPAEPRAGDDDADALVSDLMDDGDDFADTATETDTDHADALDNALATGSGDGAADHDAAFDPAHPIDGKYILGGIGTKEDPFVITWDLLILASQTYIPREGRTDMPARVKAVDGKRIKIEGFFAFPLASTDSREVLFMLNQWDGCCVGVPPSPYDAIEVRLTEPMGDGRKQFVAYGTLTGTIKVDPYVQDGWLLGIYVMQDGTIDAGL